MVLGQIGVEGKSNEITEVPKLLAMLSLEGTIVTADASTASAKPPNNLSIRTVVISWP